MSLPTSSHFSAGTHPLRLGLFIAWWLYFIPCTGIQSQSLADQYAWRYPVPHIITGAPDLIHILREEFDNIIQFHPLAPIRLAFSDLFWEDYFLYQEPGRLITTFAWAYPYLAEQQQVVVDQAVSYELNQDHLAPWSPHFSVPRDEGSARTWYGTNMIWGLNSSFGDFRPRLHTLYGFWLYAYRSGKTEMMTSYYDQVKSFYMTQHPRAKLYGDMCGHIAMARLAEANDDMAMQEFALMRLQEELVDGLDLENKHAYAQNGFQGWDAPYNRSPGSAMYDSRKDGWIYRGFIFLNMGPEMARFLHDSCFTQVDAMHTAGTQLFPLWWLMQAPYFNRWTGDEGIGLPSEAFGMYHPVAAWIQQESPEQLRHYMRSSPTGIGDCYWLEALVQTIEAHATSTTWEDVRVTPFPPVTIDTTTAVTTISGQGISWTFFPNPTREYIELSWNNIPDAASWTVNDTRGVTIAAGHLTSGGGTNKISCQYWPAGTYTITLRSTKNDWVQSKIIQKL